MAKVLHDVIDVVITFFLKNKTSKILHLHGICNEMEGDHKNNFDPMGIYS